METIRTRVPAHAMQRRWGEVSDIALREPVAITDNGRSRHVLMSLEEYERLKARDRLAFRIEDLPDDLAALLEGGLDDLWNPRTVAEDGDNLIG